MSKLVGEFLGGLTATTRASWVGIVAFAWLELALCCLLVTPQRLATIDRHWLMETPHDEYADLTVRLLALRYSKVAVPHVSFLGASNSTRSLVAHDDETMSAELEAVYGKPVRFDVFSTNNQRYEDWLQIADQLPKSYHGVLVLEMHDMKDDYRGNPMRNAVVRRRLALPSTPAMTRIWKAQGVDYARTGNYFLDHLGFFASRRWTAFRVTPVGDEWYWGGGRNPIRFNELMAHLQRVKRDAADGKPPFDVNRRPPAFVRSRRVLARVVAIIKAHHGDVLMVQAPRFPPRAEIYHARVERFSKDMETFCQEFGCYAWDSNADIEFLAEDFQDAIHLNNPGKRREFTDILLAKATMLLRRQDERRQGKTQEEDVEELPPFDGRSDGPAGAGARDAGVADDSDTGDDDE